MERKARCWIVEKNYNPDGSLASETTTLPDGSKSVKTYNEDGGHSVVEYDETGNMTTEALYGLDENGEVTEVSRTHYMENGDGTVTTETCSATGTGTTEAA
ncbi:MAG: hypothetical protein ISR47_06365 [Rhodospirillales bacterium]|nr:hypothetical protein [Rhodospirillales bacterium]